MNAQSTLARKWEQEHAKMQPPRLYLCDFGYGIQRYDIDRLALHEDIAKDGTYEGMGLACQFDFQLLAWVREVKHFLRWDKKRSV